MIAILTIRLLLLQQDGTLAWEEHHWHAPIDAANPAAVRAEILKHTRDYFAGRPCAGVQYYPDTCARPVSGLH